MLYEQVYETLISDWIYLTVYPVLETAWCMHFVVNSNRKEMVQILKKVLARFQAQT